MKNANTNINLNEMRLIANGEYAVTKSGDVISFKRSTPKILSPYSTRYGYQKVDLSLNGKRSKRYVHNLVLEAFEPIPTKKRKGLECNHKNEIKTDNHISNLQWISHRDNCNYGNRNSKISQSLKRYYEEKMKDHGNN